MAVFVTKNVYKCAKCDRTSEKVSHARTSHARLKSFFTHITHVRVCAHVCEFNFANQFIQYWNLSLPAGII